MKTLAALILTMILTACGSGSIEPVTQADEAIAQPAVIVEPEPATPAPEKCNETTYNPCQTKPTPAPEPICNPRTDATCIPPEGMEICDMWSYIPCANPTWIPKRP